MIKIDELISRCCKATVRIGSAEEMDLGEETTVKNSDGNLKVEVGACQHCQMLMNNRQLGKTHYRIIERFAKDMGYDCKPVIREDSISNI